MDINRLNTKLQDLHTRIAKIRQDMSIASDKLTQYDPTDSNAPSQIQREQQNIARLNVEAQKLEEEAERTTQELVVKRQDDERLASQESDIVKQLEDANRQKTALEQQLKDIQSQRGNLAGSTTSFF